MTSDELIVLLQEIRRGRTEGDSLEWKRQWWDLKSAKGKTELRRDIASLANSARGIGILIVGLKDGRLYEAALPCDEAELQQIIQSIIPSPTVAIEVVMVEGTNISVLTVAPPFDRPYVTQSNELNVVFVRHGSSIASASRFELDTYYQQQERRPSLTAEWKSWAPGTIPSIQRKGATKSNTLEIPRPRLRVGEIPDIYHGRLNALKESHRTEGYPDAEQLAEYEAHLTAFLEGLSDQRHLAYWYIDAHWHKRAVPFTAVFTNNGTSPASEVKLRIKYPEWLVVFDELSKIVPKGYVKPPATPPRPMPPKSALEEMTEAVNPRFPEVRPLPMPMPYIPSINQASGNQVSARARTVNFWADRVLHAHSIAAVDTLSAIALPNAPQTADPILLEAEIFYSEIERWRPVELRVGLIELAKRQ